MQTRHFESFDEAFQDLTQLIPIMITSNQAWDAHALKTLFTLDRRKEVPHAEYEALLNHHHENLIKGILTVFADDFVITEQNTPIIQRMIQHLCHWKQGCVAAVLFSQLPHKQEKAIATNTFIDCLKFDDYAKSVIDTSGTNPLYLAVYYDIAPAQIEKLISQGAEDRSNADDSAWMLALMTHRTEIAIQILRKAAQFSYTTYRDMKVTVQTNYTYTNILDRLRSMENDYIELQLPVSPFFPAKQKSITVQGKVGYRTFLEARCLIESRYNDEMKEDKPLVYTAQDKAIFLSLMRAKLWQASTVKECQQIWETYRHSACLNYKRHLIMGYDKATTGSLLNFLELVHYRMTFLLAQQWQDNLYPPVANHPNDNNYISPDVLTPAWATKSELKELKTRDGLMHLMQSEGVKKGKFILPKSHLLSESVDMVFIKTAEGKKLLSDSLAIANVEKFLEAQEPNPNHLVEIFSVCNRRNIDEFMVAYALKHWDIKKCVKLFQFIPEALYRVKMTMSEVIQDNQHFTFNVPDVEGVLVKIDPEPLLGLKFRLIKIMSILEASGFQFQYTIHDGYDVLACISEELLKAKTADEVLKIYRYCEKFKCLNTKHSYVYDDERQSPKLAWMALDQIKIVEPLYPVNLLVTQFKDLFVDAELQHLLSLKSDVRKKMQMDEKKPQSDYSSEEKATILLLLKAQLKKAKNVDEILAVYTHYIDAACMNYHRDYFVGFTKKYTQTKIEFIELVQYYVALRLYTSLAFSPTAMDRNAIMGKVNAVLQHAAFSPSHNEKGVSPVVKQKLAADSSLKTLPASVNFCHRSEWSDYFQLPRSNTEANRRALHLSYQSFLTDITQKGFYHSCKQRAKAQGYPQAFGTMNDEYRDENFIDEMQFFYDARVVLAKDDEEVIKIACQHIKKANSDEMLWQLSQLIFKNALNPKKDRVTTHLLGLQSDTIQTSYAEIVNGVIISTLLKLLFRTIANPKDAIFEIFLTTHSRLYDVDFMALRFALHHCCDAVCEQLLKKYDHAALIVFKRELDASIIDHIEFPCYVPDLQGNLQEVDANLIKHKFYQVIRHNKPLLDWLSLIQVKPSVLTHDIRQELFIDKFIADEKKEEKVDKHQIASNSILVSRSDQPSSSFMGGLVNFFKGGANTPAVQYPEEIKAMAGKSKMQ